MSRAARGLAGARRDHRGGKKPAPTLADDGETGKIQPYPGSGTPSNRIWMRSVRPRIPSKYARAASITAGAFASRRSEEHTSELQSRENLVCRLLLEKKKKTAKSHTEND